MKILITGGAGFIGYHLVNALKEDHTVYVLDDFSTGNNKVEGVEYQKYCVYEDKEWWGKYYKDIDVIYHLAAVSRIQPSFNDPWRTTKINIMGTQAVLEYARKYNCRVIYPASSSKFGGELSSPYAWTKVQGEKLCKLYNQTYGVDVAIPRFYNVYGPKQPQEGVFATVMGIFEKQYKEGKPLTIEGTGKQRRDFTHVEDLAIALKLIGQLPFGFCKEWELGTGKNHSMNEIVDYFGSKRVYIEDRKGQYPETLCTDTEARNKLGWKPKWDLKEYINIIRLFSADLI
jgi:UDP-glucose 4-epimerase